jgi:hypothetical protein
MSTSIRSKLSFANVTSCLALFIALGGTSYAVTTLPRNSVGSNQLRPKSVGSSELKTAAVSSRAVKNGSISSSDLSATARASLRGQAGPAGPVGPAGPAGVTLRAAVPSGGTVAAGNAIRATHQGGTNEYVVEFAQSVAGCIPTATLAAVQSGPTLEQPEAGRITVAASGAGVLVKTYRADGTAAEQPFNLIVAC